MNATAESAAISLTLIAAAPQPALTAWAAQCCAALQAVEYPATIRALLSTDAALDIAVMAENSATTLTHIRQITQTALADYPVDSIVQPSAGRQKRLLVADMESTIIEQEMLEEMAETIGQRAEVTAITQQAMNGELDFAAALLARVQLFAGQPARMLQAMAARMTLMPGAATLVATMRQQGATCILASGGFRFYTRLIAEQLGFHRDYANDLVIADGQLTGMVALPILDKASKLSILQHEAAALGVTLSQTITVGDGANDLPMLTACSAAGGLGIAFRAKPAVQAAATHTINHGDLTALLFAQGLG
jgi:phosphoserine phosphatase